MFKVWIEIEEIDQEGDPLGDYKYTSRELWEGDTLELAEAFMDSVEQCNTLRAEVELERDRQESKAKIYETCLNAIKTALGKKRDKGKLDELTIILIETTLKDAEEAERK